MSRVFFNNLSLGLLMAQDRKDFCKILAAVILLGQDWHLCRLKGDLCNSVIEGFLTWGPSESAGNPQSVPTVRYVHFSRWNAPNFPQPLIRVSANHSDLVSLPPGPSCTSRGGGASVYLCLHRGASHHVT